MSKAEIEVTFDGGNAQQYHPHEQVKGDVVIYPNSDITCRKVLVQVLWRTEGRGTRHQKIIGGGEVFQGVLKQGMPQTFSFSEILPDAPWSFQGRYVSVAWGVWVKIDVPMGRDVEHFERFALVPKPLSES